MSSRELTEGQHRFAEMLLQVPWLADYWDVPNNSYDRDRLEAALGVWSHGEQIMARFFVMVWNGRNEMEFDLADAAAILDPDSRRLITDWFMDPFWP